MDKTTAYVPTAEDFRLKENNTALETDENFGSMSLHKELLVRFLKRKGSVIGLVMILLITLFAIIGPSMNEYSFSSQELDQKNLAPRIPGIENLGVFDGSETLTKTTGSVKVNNYETNGFDDIYYWFGSDNGS